MNRDQVQVARQAPSVGDSLQQQVLDFIQSGFPLEEDPYGVLAAQFGVLREAIKEAVYALCISGGVRRIGASFDSRKLGYTSTLCALAIPGGEADVLRAAEVVNRFPGVTHNYGRVHRYNMWFTLITRSVEEKTAILDAIRRGTGCNDVLDTPSIRKFKVSVDFGKHRAQDKVKMGCESDPHSTSHVTQSEPDSASNTNENISLVPFNAEDPFDVELVRWAQDDIARDEHGELIDDPYVVGAAHMNAVLGRDDLQPSDLIGRLRELKYQKTIRRFGAMVRHQIIGFAYNSMTVWDIPDDVVEKAGELFATAHFVSHCYTRPRAKTWPVNLYAMIHAQTAEELVSNIETLQTMLEAYEIPCSEHFALETTDEYKKVSMRYFIEENPVLIQAT